MVGSAAIKQGRSANRKHTYFIFWPNQTNCVEYDLTLCPLRNFSGFFGVC